jgi:hypothetical protein
MMADISLMLVLVGEVGWGVPAFTFYGMASLLQD